MRCADAREQMVAWLDGEADPDLAERLESHLANCADCRRERMGFESTGDVLARLGRPSPSPDFAERVVAAARSGEDPWCLHIRRELVAFCDGELTDVESRPVLEHLSECEACEGERCSLVRTWDALSEWKAPAFQVDLLDRLPVAASAPKQKGRLLRLLPAVAAASLLVAAGLLGFLTNRGETGSLEPPAEVLRNLDVLQAEALNLLDEPTEMIEVADNLDWLDGLAESELALLDGSGG